MSNNKLPVDDPHAALEEMLIEEYLGSRGYTRHSLNELGAPDAASLLRAASEYVT